MDTTCCRACHAASIEWMSMRICQSWEDTLAEWSCACVCVCVCVCVCASKQHVSEYAKVNNSTRSSLSFPHKHWDYSPVEARVVACSIVECFKNKSDRNTFFGKKKRKTENKKNSNDDTQDDGLRKVVFQLTWHRQWFWQTSCAATGSGGHRQPPFPLWSIFFFLPSQWAGGRVEKKERRKKKTDRKNGNDSPTTSTMYPCSKKSRFGM